MDASTQLSPNYTVGDLIKTSTGLPNMPDDSYLPNLTALANVLEYLAAIDSFTIESGFRSPAVNAAIGGAGDSYHSDGLAADILPDNLTNQDFFRYIRSTPRFANAVGEYIFYPLSHGTIHVSAATAQKQNFPLSMTNGSYTSDPSTYPAPDPTYNLDANPGAAQSQVAAAQGTRNTYIFMAIGLAVILGAVAYARGK